MVHAAAELEPLLYVTVDEVAGVVTVAVNGLVPTNRTVMVRTRSGEGLLASRSFTIWLPPAGAAVQALVATVKVAVVPVGMATEEFVGVPTENQLG
jgi:hypothetical protein